VRLYAVERDLPTLEDVYFALHGQRARPSAADPAPVGDGSASRQRGEGASTHDPASGPGTAAASADRSGP
jgi:hypothetical protein